MDKNVSTAEVDTFFKKHGDVTNVDFKIAWRVHPIVENDETWDWDWWEANKDKVGTPWMLEHRDKLIKAQIVLNQAYQCSYLERDRYHMSFSKKVFRNSRDYHWDEMRFYDK